MQDFLTIFKVITAYYIVLWVLFGICWILTGIIIKNTKRKYKTIRRF